ncbi:MAG TPA: CHAT domain-containing protein, partial [Blastocatellia bacterium]|nr:CHAT domain-containing protein [Blastocatellia bacterium]
LHSYTQALSLRQEVGDRRGEAETLDDLGQLFDLSGDQQKALASYRQALGLRRAVEDRGGEAATLYNIARIEREKGNLDEARSHIEAACALVETLRTRVVSQELRASYLASTHQQYELYVDVLMRLHRQRPSEALDAAAFHASELARARTLIEMLAEGRADIRQGVEPALLDSERSLNQLLSDKTERYSRLLANAHTEKQAAAAAIEIEGIKNDYQEIQARIRSSSPRYAALTQPQPLSVRQLQQQVLDQETILLEYALGDERSYLWAITADSLASFDLPKRADIEAEARRVYRLLTSRHKTVDGETERRKAARVASDELKYQEEAANLSRILLGPVSSQLGTKRLVIVADGALQYIPFGALPAPPAEGFGQARTLARSDIDEAFRPYSRPLIVEHEIVSLPSATTLAVMRRELADRKPAPRAVAVLADPVFSRFDPRVISSRAGASRQDDVSTPRDLERAIKEVRISRNRNEVARLPFSRAEAAAIKAASGGQAMEAVDFEASRATAMSDKLSQYRVIHFATHGLLNSEHPEMSGIVFSLVDRHGKSQNGFLRLHDLYNLNLPAELVVLSACQTALGKDVKGEGLVGLTRGFMYAGAARVVASLWQVDDSATAGLMQRFYSKMLEDGLRPSAALRDAQVEMWNQKRWHAPYYWAGFVLQGEWK